MGLDDLFEDSLDRVTEQLVQEFGEERVLEALETRPDLLAEPMREAIEKTAPLLVESLKKAASEMLEDRRQGLANYSAMVVAHWGAAFDLYEMVLRVAFEAGEDFVTRHTDEARGDPVFFVLANLHARACRIAEEALVLMKAGFGQAAQTRWRALHEVTVVAHFVRKHGEEVARRYLDHEGVESWKIMEEYQSKVDRMGYEPYSDDELAEGKARHDALCQQYGDSFAGAYGWAAEALRQAGHTGRTTLGDVENNVEMDHLRPHYRMASHGAHAQPKGILFRPDQLEAERDLLAGPSILGMADPGHSVCISLTNTTAALLMSKPGMASPPILAALLQLTDEAGEAFLRAHRELEEGYKPPPMTLLGPCTAR